MSLVSVESSAHYYDKDGNPRHTVPYADPKRKGEFRSTTVTDAKKNVEPFSFELEVGR
jgi:hypothetical protein